MRAVALATLLGLLVRLRYVIASDFPLNDGGMFVVMTRDLQRVGFALPDVTTYNALSIPFAYPPLGFYLAGAIAAVSGSDLIELFRWLPLFLSTAAIPMFALLARDLVSPVTARAATFAYALVPASFAWLVMGGGLTRSLGMVLALASLAALQRALLSSARGPLVLAGALAGLTALAHATVAEFLVFGAILLVARVPSRAALAALTLVGALALLVSAPWWATVLARHGLAPFLAASAREDTLAAAVFTLVRWNAWYEPFLPVVAALALVGLVVSLARRDYLTPAWMLALALFVPLQFQMVSAVPLALLAGVGVTGMAALIPTAGARRAAAVAVVAYALLAAALASTGDLAGLSREERAAMAWLARETPAGARVLVVTSQRAEVDRTGEWLPALSGRQSIAITQGTEWLSGGILAQRTVLHERARRCATSDGDCVARLGAAFDYLYLPALRSSIDATPVPCCTPLADSLRGDARYSLVYTDAGAVIFARR